MQTNPRIVLVNPSHPGNIGASARAMKNMGLTELALISPQCFPSGEATARASGAEDILENALVVDSLAEGLAGCDFVFGTSARSRRLEKPLLTPEEAAHNILGKAPHKSAIIFGRERTGLTNEELAICHAHIVIPTVNDFSSLNLSQAVQIVSYTLHLASLSTSKPSSHADSRNLASADQMAGFYQHLQDSLIQIGFLKPSQPKMLMQRLQRLFNRTEVDVTELNILRGILSDINKTCSK